MAVIGEAGRGGHYHGIAVGERLVSNAFDLIIEGHLPVSRPVPHLVHATLPGVIAPGQIVYQVVLSVEVDPVAIPRAQLTDVRLSVEDPAAGSSGHAGNVAVSDGLEAVAEAVGRPGKFVGIAVAGVHYGHDGFADRLQLGCFLMRKSQRQQGEAVVKLRIAILDFATRGGPAGGGESAFRIPAEGNAMVFMSQFPLQQRVAADVGAEDAGEEALIVEIARFRTHDDALFVNHLVQHQHILYGRRDEENEGHGKGKRES